VARPKLNGEGAHLTSFTLDGTTLTRLEKLSKEIGIHNKSALVRLLINEAYKRIVIEKQKII